MRESKIEKHLVRRVKEQGGEVRKLKWIERNSSPDRIVMHPKLRCFVELKATGKDATEAQAREHNRMRAMGEIVHVFNSIEQIDEWILRDA